MSRRTRIKFCGFTRARDLEYAVALGVDAIGLVCVPHSRRALSIAEAVALRRMIPAFVTCAALLLDPSAEEVDAVLEYVRPDLLQFHGRESGAFCRRFGVPYVKAVAMGTGVEGLPDCAQYVDAAGLMVDSHAPGALGGTGTVFDWQRLRTFDVKHLILAGGVSADNVGQAIAELHPYAVDVSSGIEAGTPGVKDSGKMAAFVDAVRRADAVSQSEES